MGTSSIDWAQLIRFYLKKETGSSLRNVVFCYINRTMFLDIDRTMDNVQKLIFVLMHRRHKLLDLIHCNIILQFTGWYSKSTSTYTDNTASKIGRE
jgi:hypothetical protein